MKKYLHIIISIIVCLIISGCELFGESNPKVTFDYNCEGINDYNCSILDNKLNCMITLPECEGKTFVGWYDAKASGKEVNLDSDFTESTTIYAVWDDGKTKTQPKQTEEKKYTISFKLNGGYGKTNNVSVKNGEELPEITTSIPTRKDYTFTGWYDNSDYTKGKQYYNENNEGTRNYDLKKNLVLYAGWEKENDAVEEPVVEKVYSISFDANGGTGGQTENVSVKYGNDLPNINTKAPTRSGYEFMGWYDNSDYTKGTKYYSSTMQRERKYNVSKNIILYAGWEAKSYTVSFNKNDGTGKIATVSAKYGNTMPTIKISVPTRSGYTFTGWYDNSDYTKGKKYYTETNTPSRDYDKVADTTLYAGWSRNSVTQVNISGSTIIVAPTHMYTGKSITPEVTVTYGSKTLIKNTDYAVSYYDNIEVGTARVKINGIGNYTGSKETTFKITKQEAKITCQNKTYNGSKQVIAECEGGTISNATQTNVGSYTITCKGDKNHADAENKTCTIYAKDLSTASLSSIADQKYTGSAIEPLVTVTLNSKTLVKNTDYTISYSNNTNVGTAKVTITGKNNYKGTKTTTFKIVKEENPKTPAQITCSDKQYTGSAQTIATCSGGTISNATQTSVGSYTITCKGDSNHTDASSKICKITTASISNASTSTVSNQNYTGSEIKPTVTVKLGARTLTKDTDYTLSYSNNTNPGVAKITVTGKGNYTGTILKTFNINPKVTFNANGGTGSMSAQYVTYNTATKLNGNTLTRTDYTFNGWNTTSNGSGTSYANEANLTTKSNVTLYAQWKIDDTYTITYNLNGGTNPSNAKTTYKKTDATFNLPTPTKSNYVFIGWYENNNFSGKAVTKIKNGSTGNKIFYARWIGSNQFLVQYDCNGGSGAPSEQILTSGDIFVPAYSTCKKSGKEFNAWLNAEGTDWTFKAISNYKNGKYGITNNIIKLKAQWTTAMSKNSNQIKPNLTGKTKLTCKDLFSKNSSNPKNVINVYCEYSTSTLKYIIVKPEWNYLLTYIWVKDSYKQTNLAIATQMNSSSVSKRNLWKTNKIIDNEISTKNYSSKSLVAFNASAMVSERFNTDTPNDWKYGPANQYVKSGGKLIRNSVNNADESKNKYWLGGYRYIAGIGSDGALKYYIFAMRKQDSEYTDAKKAINSRIIEYVENNGIKDTFGWYGTYRNYYYESGNTEEKTNLPDEKGASPALCQLDLNNFIFITQSFNNGDVGGRDNRKVNGMNTLQIIKGLGCNRTLRVDGGGSTAIWAKDGSGTYGPGRAYDGRNSADLFYFVEQ